MLTAVADWSTEAITFDLRKGVQVLAVLGDYRTCDPDTLRGSLAESVGITRENIFAGRSLLVIAAPLGTFTEPADYRAWVDEAVSEAERDSIARRRLPPELARIAADNIASLAADAGLPPDAIMRAAMVYPGTADAIMRGESLPPADLVRIATALGVPAQSLLLPVSDGPGNPRG